MECPQKCKHVVLHTAPKQWIPNIVENGFELPINDPKRISYGKGVAEDDVLFFEKLNATGARYIFAWMDNLHRNREDHPDMGIVTAEICSCHVLDKKTLDNNKHALAVKGTEFIMNAQGYPEKDRQWALDHFGTRLESEYNDPMSFLRKIAIDSEHIVYGDPLTEAEKPTASYLEKSAGKKVKDIKRYGMGEVMKSLGFEIADGYTGSHSFSRDDRNRPINEIIVADPSIISAIHEIDPKSLCGNALNFDSSYPLLKDDCIKRKFIEQ
jgi:hypothetical protein